MDYSIFIFKDLFNFLFLQQQQLLYKIWVDIQGLSALVFAKFQGFSRLLLIFPGLWRLTKVLVFRENCAISPLSNTQKNTHFPPAIPPFDTSFSVS